MTQSRGWLGSLRSCQFKFTYMTPPQEIPKASLNLSPSFRCVKCHRNSDWCSFPPCFMVYNTCFPDIFFLCYHLTPKQWMWLKLTQKSLLRGLFPANFFCRKWVGCRLVYSSVQCRHILPFLCRFCMQAFVTFKVHNLILFLDMTRCVE
jgi:hypothetical protein